MSKTADITNVEEAKDLFFKFWIEKKTLSVSEMSAFIRTIWESAQKARDEEWQNALGTIAPEMDDGDDYRSGWNDCCSAIYNVQREVEKGQWEVTSSQPKP